MSNPTHPEPNYGIQNFNSQISGPQAAGPNATAAYSVGDNTQLGVNQIDNQDTPAGKRPEATPDDTDPAGNSQLNHARGHGTIYAVTDGDMHIRFKD
ncbi:hypothetical protein [Nocardia sp. alder85J]|uniref:hypothetical protein n=1 Tax=Nocardia sp. alder85J TaxID=2862949 RepID=UPI001CD6C070|nr:hypothetical protein [Nocardia sp. alder85J]MCX4095524.1 hypothetical protein [Nocardia sp. alder85J]